MTITTINIGHNPNDGLGDDLRTAFEKVNANFTTLATAANAVTGVSITASANPSGYSIFKGLVGSTLSFKELRSGSRISITETIDSVIISNSASMFTTVSNGYETYNAGISPILKINGDDDISITLTQPIAESAPGITPYTPAIPGVVNIKSNTPVGKVLQTYDFGQLNTSVANVFHLYLTTNVIDFGTIPDPNPLIIDLGIIG